MAYFTKVLPNGKTVAVTGDEVVLPVYAVEEMEPEAIGRLVLQLSVDCRVLKEYAPSGVLDGMSLDEAKTYILQAKQQEQTQGIKRDLTRARRRQFASLRDQILLKLIERDGYVCQHVACDCQEDLTIDHIVPLSKGGSDDLSNLRLLCRKHNSEKSDALRAADTDKDDGQAQVQ